MIHRLLPIPLFALACGGDGQAVGRVSVDWSGNDIEIDALADPDVAGVVCHVAYFNRSFVDRVGQGNVFEDPSWSALDCNAAGPIVVGDIAPGPGGEEIFREGRSLIWKSLRVTRVWDPANRSLIYLAHARELHQGSGKMSMSVVPLTGPDVTWRAGGPPR